LFFTSGGVISCTAPGSASGFGSPVSISITSLSKKFPISFFAILNARWMPTGPDFIRGSNIPCVSAINCDVFGAATCRSFASV
jgi:hypothetical protein